MSPEWQCWFPFDYFLSSPLPLPEQSSLIDCEEKSNFLPRSSLILRPHFQSKQWDNEVFEEKDELESDESTKMDGDYKVEVEGHYQNQTSGNPMPVADQERGEPNSEDQRDKKNAEPTFDDVFDFSDIYECFDEIEHPLSLYIQLSYRYSMMASSLSQFPPQRGEGGISLIEEGSTKA